MKFFFLETRSQKVNLEENSLIIISQFILNRFYKFSYSAHITEKQNEDYNCIEKKGFT